MTIVAPGYDGERDRGLAAELLGDDAEVAPAALAHAGRYLRLCSTERLKSTWRSSLWRMNFFRRASKSGSAPRLGRLGAGSCRALIDRSILPSSLMAMTFA